MARSLRRELEKDNPVASMPYATHAILTIRHASAMTSWRRQEIASWLRRQADNLQKEGTKYSRRFTARYQTR
jgi:hypothetical protein